MSNVDEFRKKNSGKYKHDPEAAKKNALLKASYSKKKDWFYKRFWRWLTSTEKQLLREIATNWIILVAPIAIITIASVSSDMLEKNQFMSLEELGGYSLVILIVLIIFIVALLYKLILKFRKRKGIYWPEKRKK